MANLYAPLEEKTAEPDSTSVQIQDIQYDVDDGIPVINHAAKAQTKFVQRIIALCTVFRILESLIVVMLISMPNTREFITDNYGLIIASSLGVVFNMIIASAYGTRLWTLVSVFLMLFHALCIGFLVGCVALVTQRWVVAIFMFLTIPTHFIMFFYALINSSNLLTKGIHRINFACISLTLVAATINMPTEFLWILPAAIGSMVHHAFVISNFNTILSRFRLNNWISGAFALTADVYHKLYEAIKR